MSNRQPRPLQALVLLFLAVGLIAGVGGYWRTRPVPSSASYLMPTMTPAIAVASTNWTPAPTPSTSTPAPTPNPTPTPIPQPVNTGSVTPPRIGAVSAVVIDDTSGSMLYEKNIHVQLAPASITKIVTAIVALEQARPDNVVTAQYDASELVDSTLMGLYPNDTISLRDLLFGLMLPSGNDAALAIANYVAGSSKDFAALMNKRMSDLGLQDSHFVNPHGLDARGHYTSSYDMAMVARYAMRSANFRELASASSYTVRLTRQGQAVVYPIYNLNKLLAVYKGADGVKIGYTEDALHTIVGSATRDGHRLYAAVLGSENLWIDTPPLLDYAFKNFKWPDAP